MKLFEGKISGEQLEDFFLKAIDYQINELHKRIESFEKRPLFTDWRVLIQSIDEIINIPFELRTAEDVGRFLNIDFDFFEPHNINSLTIEMGLVENQFGKSVADRLYSLCMMTFFLHDEYVENGMYCFTGSNFSLSTAQNAIHFFQSRRLYYQTILCLIPNISNGHKRVSYSNILDYFQPVIDTIMVGITSSYQYLLLNECLSDFEMTSNGKVAHGNFAYTHLEGFFTEPERLSLLDQLELRKEIAEIKTLNPKPNDQIFGFAEVSSTMMLFEGAFKKYNINQTKQFNDLNLFFDSVVGFLVNDYDIIIPKDDFQKIEKQFSGLVLCERSSDYFVLLNGYAPFQENDDKYYSTVVLLTRFAYRTMSSSLLKNRTFQIHSGFIFEDRVAEILRQYGFEVKDQLTRIKGKEFDLITIKNGKIYNFQCKNNFLGISKIGFSHKKMGKMIKALCKYYENALVKEKNRENLIQEKLGIQDIEHFVVCRFPVITRNERIINFNDLENRLKTRL